jgi:hypothetical protein
MSSAIRNHPGGHCPHFSGGYKRYESRGIRASDRAVIDDIAKLKTFAKPGTWLMAGPYTGTMWTLQRRAFICA